MRVLMFGWEFPPYISGGLGTACYGITKGLSQLGTDVVFVVPTIKGEVLRSHVDLVPSDKVRITRRRRTVETFMRKYDIPAPLTPYMRPSPSGGVVNVTQEIIEDEIALESAKTSLLGLGEKNDYGTNLFEEVFRYSEVAAVLARKERFDVIHAHDWITAVAGLKAKTISGKPFILHVHSLEFDRGGECMSREIYNIELQGMRGADHIIAVSHYTRNAIIEKYGIPKRKVSVVHNAVSREEAREVYHVRRNPDEKIVLFLGRFTQQKGPEYFVESAAKVLQSVSGVRFVMVGGGELLPRIIQRVAELGIGKHFNFTGFLRGSDVERIYAMSDVYVMPSVSEPFGITSLEAALYDVPVVISRQSGVAEVLKGALKVDFWDIREMANKIIAILSYPALAQNLIEISRDELKGVYWKNAARKILDVYKFVSGPTNRRGV